ncbi:MAG: hypothetical protein MUF51_07785 [Vicinamibacteria bacterium]|jgi:hypothetical protein|nr:hypothetical protein [Vicinamibacteria bacterium]
MRIQNRHVAIAAFFFGACWMTSCGSTNPSPNEVPDYTPVVSAPVVTPEGLLLTVSAPKSIKVDDLATVTVRVMNSTSQAVALGFLNSCVSGYVVETDAGVTIDRPFGVMECLGFPASFVLAPGQSREDNFHWWGRVGEDDHPLSPGTYRIVGYIATYPWRRSAFVETRILSR